MTKTQIQQVLVVLLLILFGIVWTMTRQPSAPPQPAPLDHGLTGPAPPAEAVEGQPPAGEAKLAAQAREDPAVPTRNPFRLPKSLARSLEERQRALQEALDPQKKQQRPVALSPTQAAAEAKLENLKLQGVFWGTSNPQAIINRKTLSVGDEIDGAKVLSIGKEGVTLSVSDREVLLEPPQPGQSREGEEVRGISSTERKPIW